MSKFNRIIFIWISHSLFILLSYIQQMTKTIPFTPIVLPQKQMKRISSLSSLATVNDSDQLKIDRNRKIA